MSRLRDLEREITRAQGKREALEETRTKAQARLERAEREIVLLEQASDLTQAATETRKQELNDRVETLVTRGLRAVFGRDDYEFKLNVTLARNMIGVQPVLRSKFGVDRLDLETAISAGHGGGIVDVVSFVLRVVVLSLTRPKLAPVMVLDETFRHVSQDRLRGVANLLRELSASAGVQFILITHKPELLDAADVIYRASLKDGVTSFALEHNLRDESYHQAPRRSDMARPVTAYAHHDLTKANNDAEPQQAKGGQSEIEQKRTRAKRLIKKKRKRDANRSN